MGLHGQPRARLELIVGAALTLVVLALSLIDPLRQVEVDTVDTRFGIRGAQPPPDDVVLVKIDDETFDILQEQWPFRRSMHGFAIDELRKAGAEVIAYDIQFSERSDDREDNELISAVGRARGKVVLATTVVNRHGRTNIFGNDRIVRRAGARVGHAQLPLDSDGVYRRVPSVIARLTSFPVAVAEVAGRSPAGGTAWIDYHGPPGTIRAVSFADVLLERADPAFFRDKIVVVGSTASTLQDVHFTSVSEHRISGAEIHANAISTLLRGEPLREAPAWVKPVLIVLLGMLAQLLTVRFGWKGLLLGVVSGLLYLVAVQLAFDAGVILPVVYPLIAMLMSWTGVLIVGYATAIYERQRVHDLFGRFVPESAVDGVLQSAEQDLRLAGKTLTSTAVFCDLRGFTGFAEQRTPEDVIATLNRYMTEMSEAIRAHGGTLLAYVGDGILAVFGAPIPQHDHADRAVAAVREMAGERLERFNAWLAEKHPGERFRIGIGVNSGAITCGNVGCDWRLEYTAVGDAVNTASRLESMTKDTPHQVLISDTTKAMMLADTTGLRYIDAMSIRGKQVKANLWTLEQPDAEPVAAGSRRGVNAL